jgi:hypothetical protein
MSFHVCTSFHTLKIFSLSGKFENTFPLSSCHICGISSLHESLSVMKKFTSLTLLLTLTEKETMQITCHSYKCEYTNILMFIERKVVKSKQNSFARLLRVPFEFKFIVYFFTGIFECFSHKYRSCSSTLPFIFLYSDYT